MILLNCHYILLDVTDRLWDSSGVVLMIDDPQRIELKLFQSIKRSFDDIMIEIIIYLTTRQNETYEVTHKKDFYSIRWLINDYELLRGIIINMIDD